MFFLMKSNLKINGADVHKGELVRDVDVPDLADMFMNASSIKKVDEDDVASLVANGKAIIAAIPGADPFEIPMLETEEVNQFEVILDHNVTDATALIEEIESAEFLAELREYEVADQNRKGIHRAIDDQIVLCDPTPMDEAPHEIAETEE